MSVIESEKAGIELQQQGKSEAGRVVKHDGVCISQQGRAAGLWVGDKEESQSETALTPSGKQPIGDRARALIGLGCDRPPVGSRGFV